MGYNSGNAADFHVYTGLLRDADERMEAISKQMDSINEELRQVKRTLAPYRIISRTRLTFAQYDLAAQSRCCEVMGGKLSAAARLYERTDDRAAGKNVWNWHDIIDDYFDTIGPGGVASIIPIIGPTPGGGSGGGGGGSWGDEEKPQGWTWDFFNNKPKDEHKFGEGGFDFKDHYYDDGKNNGLSQKIHDFNDAHKEDLDIPFRGNNINGKYINGVKIDPNDEAANKQFDELTDENGKFKGVDVKLYSSGVGTENSLIRGDGLLGDEKGSHLSGQVRVGNFDANAGWYAGILGLGGTAGVSLSLLHLAGEAQAGNDMLGAYVKGDVDVLKGELKADGSVGLFDANGKFSPNAHVGGSAEALLAEASATGGVKVAGTDIGVKGSVNVGIGAHADLGFKDWKFTADIGASIGVGVGVSVEVDLSGTVEAIAGAADSVISVAGDVLEGTGEFIGNAAEDVGNFFGSVGDGVANFFGW